MSAIESKIRRGEFLWHLRPMRVEDHAEQNNLEMRNT